VLVRVRHRHRHRHGGWVGTVGHNSYHNPKKKIQKRPEKKNPKTQKAREAKSSDTVILNLPSKSCFLEGEKIHEDKLRKKGRKSSKGR